ncbi:MAG: LysM peptidoglycan-binding domain-containing protein [Spirochaetales bacterium]|nr:MAG: LysM peptidoglycan-binding domain-containing protein [Spirochaetales bacterium]
MTQRTALAAIALLLLGLSTVLAADPLTHVVQKGETLYGIARSYNISLDDLVKANGIKDPAKVLPGTKLSIPSAAFSYVVQKGDTLYGISRRFGLGVDVIISYNGLASSMIKPGQALKIPGGAVAVNGSQSTTATIPVPNTVPHTITTPISHAIPPVVPAVFGIWPAAGELSYLQGKLKGAAISVKPGDSISAIRMGTVISAGPFRGFGKVAFVQSSDGLVYVYGGASSLQVRVGDPVRKGTVVGKADASEDGNGTVYFFAFKGSDSLDPDSVPRD